MSKAEQHSAWLASLYQVVESIGPEGAAAVAYLRAHRTSVGFLRAAAHVGAIWTPLRGIRINSRYYSYETPLTSARLLTLVIHEARHLQQGPVMALSVYGELEAWQLDFGVFRRLTGKELPPVLLELMSLPLGWDREVLRRAQKLMRVYAGKGYRSDLLPLYPLDKELAYKIFRRKPSLMQ
jgi:hypothetical protein